MADDPQSSEIKNEKDQEEGSKKLISVTVKTPKEKEVIEVNEESTVAQVHY